MIDKNKMSLCFAVLDRIWGRDVAPAVLERHYFLYWFAVHQGDEIRVAEAIRAHRNTVRYQFDRFGLSDSSDGLLRFWRELSEKNKKLSFETKFFKFYRPFNMKDPLSLGENRILIDLWQKGFFFKAISAHYMLWAIRNDKPKEWFQKKLGFSSHHCMRVLVSVLDPRTDNGHWLAPLKPVVSEIYARGPRELLGKRPAEGTPDPIRRNNPVGTVLDRS